MDKKLVISASPHITDSSSTRGLMLNVIIALLPTAIVSGFIFGARAILVIGVTTAACVGFEALYDVLMKKPQTVGDLSAVVTGIILAFNLPSTIPLWIAIVGAFVAIVVTKQLFGGLGCNFANPALVGRIALFIGFASRMTTYGFPATAAMDSLATATPLAAASAAADAIASATTQAAAAAIVPIEGMPIFGTLLLGTYGGVLGETCSITLILGGIYLIATKTIDFMIPVSYIGTVAILSLVLGQDVILQVFSGGLLLGAFFMATDYVTSPFTLKGKLIYGIGLGVITCLIRFYGNMAEGVSFSLLLMNLLVPYINSATRQTPLGGAKKK